MSDTNTYPKLPHYPLPEFSVEASHFTERALDEGIISQAEAAFLQRHFYKATYFYHLLKVHKNLNNPLGRPIVSAMDSVTTGFSIYIDQFLQPLSQNLPSYIRDGIHLLDTFHLYP